MFVVLVLVVKFEFFRRIEALAFAEEIGWHISSLEQILALVSLLISGCKFTLLRQHEIVERGLVERAQFITPQNVGIVGDGTFAQCFLIAHSFGHQFFNLFVEVVSAPFRVIGRAGGFRRFSPTGIHIRI